MSRWVLYIVGLAAFVGANVAALGNFQGRWIAFVVCLAVVAGVLVIQRRLVESESRQPDYRRTYEASTDATFSALYGAIIDLGYEATARNQASGILDFESGSRDLYMPRTSVNWKATVRRVNDRESEVVLAGHANHGVQGGNGHRVQQASGGLSVFPEGTAHAANKILDRLDATVIPSSLIDAALTQRPDGTA